MVRNQKEMARNQIDYILCNQRWRSSIQSARTRLGADCGSDHELFIAKFRLKFKKIGKATSSFSYDLIKSFTNIQWKCKYIQEITSNRASEAL